jgi:hypothetical protein
MHCLLEVNYFMTEGLIHLGLVHNKLIYFHISVFMLPFVGVMFEIMLSLVLPLWGSPFRQADSRCAVEVIPIVLWKSSIHYSAHNLYPGVVRIQSHLRQTLKPFLSLRCSDQHVRNTPNTRNIHKDMPQEDKHRDQLEHILTIQTILSLI